jgi:hypothetical protein
MHGRVEVKHLVGAALLVLLSFNRAHADPVGETHRLTTERTAVLRDAERRDQLRVTVWYPATKGSVEHQGPPGSQGNSSGVGNKRTRREAIGRNPGLRRDTACRSRNARASRNAFARKVRP